MKTIVCFMTDEWTIENHGNYFTLNAEHGWYLSHFKTFKETWETYQYMKDWY